MKAAWLHFTTWFSHLPIWQAFSALLATTPPDSWPYQKGYLALIVLCWVGLIALHFLPAHPLLKQRLAALLWFNALLDPLLFFLRYQQLPWLGMDIWRVLQEVASLIWLGMIIRYWQTGHRQVLVQEKVRQYRERYLPKPKRS